MIEKQDIIIAEKKIRDGIAITFFDRSRKIAGDRWLVELVGEVEVPVAECFWTAVDERDEDLLNCVRKELGDRLTFSLSRVRNFVDHEDKQKILDEMVRRFEENIMQYLDTPNFSEKLFVKQYKEVKEKCIATGYHPQPPGPSEEDEEQGPADFSHLFK